MDENFLEFYDHLINLVHVNEWLLYYNAVYYNCLQFVGNLLLTDVYERYYVDLEYGEEYRGVYLIRGENVVLVGELVRIIIEEVYKYN